MTISPELSQFFATLSDERKTALLERLSTELDKRKRRNKLAHFEPYPKQLEHYAAGEHARERLLLAANQVGKTYCGSMEAAMHLTGRYPEWWRGKRFERPVTMWAGSDTTETTRDTVQRLLIGPPADEQAWGEGSIPADCIVSTQRRIGVANALDTVTVKHTSGGNSTLGFKSYDQGRAKWQGTTLDFVWLDEEPPQDIYSEALTRTNAVPGARVMLTFTPLKGVSEVVRRFLMEENPARATTRMTIEDALHFSAEQRKTIADSYPEWEREARTKGIPALGSGRVYPVTEASITIPAFRIPDHWAEIGGLDFGWDHPTAAVRLAHDRDADVLYLTAAYRRRQATPIEHTAALRGWGANLWWAWGAEALQRDKRSGVPLAQDYRSAGLRMLGKHAHHADGSVGVEAGINLLLTRMQTGRFKVFDHLNDWLDEFRLYHREEGQIVKEHDDLLDATRYAVMMLRFAEPQSWGDQDEFAGDFDGRSDATGY